MNDATKELLLKVRKGATASFGVKHWSEALEAMGFLVTTVTERRSVVSISIVGPQGGTLTLTKRPGYKHIVFYDLIPWARGINLDLVKMASEALGMDTPDVERKLKELYVRDLTNTGTCPVCEGNFKRNSAEHYDPQGMVHHGYQRPGDGAIHGDCFAVGYQPWEVSPKGAEDYLAKALRPHLEDSKAYLARLQAGEITKFFKQVRTSGWNSPKTTVEITKESDPYEFESMLKSAIYQAEKDVSWTKREITRFETRIANWKPDELPEVKHAGKFSKGA